ncbi:hypothetical protein CJJ23_02790 [Mycoplasmopsis agassizii]|uniref:Uncharacterized protein n=1 Tax=Mycoplasmopsis agassizii TaxID=33922 RepID=A0A269TIP0_9BACT|nr:hypothetical protein [Mycoplasmopsis agassizii]PAK21339.1 hypothetical protein CJJ23_02790 [Mycoplasmopsis agassizii]
MSPLPILKYNKNKMFLILIAPVISVSTVSLFIACSPNIGLNHKNIQKDSTPLENKDIPKAPEPLEDKGSPKEPISPFSNKSTFKKSSTFDNTEIIKNSASNINKGPHVPFNDKSILKGSGLFVKTTIDNKNYLQLNTWNFMDFTFSDFQWIIENDWKNKKLDKTDKDRDSYNWYPVEINNSYISKWETFIKKWNWEYEPKFVADSSNQYEDFIKYFSEQKPYPNHLKSVSLVKNEGELKQALRLEDQDREKYLKYFIALEDYLYWYKTEKLSDEELSKKYFPWTETFNFDAINSKMDFEKYDYLFVKDLRSTYGDGNVGIGDLSKGIKINSYKIEPESHKFTIEFLYDDEVDPCPNCPLDEQLNHYWSWKRLSSMLIPIEKNKISEFNMNDWNLHIRGYSYIPYGRR